MKVIKSIFKGVIAIILILIIGFLMGPKMKFEEVDNIPLEGLFSITEVEEIINSRNNDSFIKKGNEEEIVWINGKEKSEYVVVYLHGFSASHFEGSPLHTNIADHFEANLFLTRLPFHGLKDSLAFKNFSPKTVVDYAKEAVKIGKSIGEKVILISCSTGAALSTYLAANDPDIDAQIMFSPNFEMYDQNTKLLTKPWGLQLARRIKGGNYHEWNAPPKARPYWYHRYRLEGIIGLQNLLTQTITDDILKSPQPPTFVGYYYKNEDQMDKTISVRKILEVKEIWSNNTGVEFVAYPEGRAHVFISPLYNPDWQKPQKDAIDFLKKTFNFSEDLLEVEI